MVGLSKVNEMGSNKLDKIICVFGENDGDMDALMKSADTSKVVLLVVC